LLSSLLFFSIGAVVLQVALQRKMFEQYEKRERQRKVAELQDVVPGLTAEEAERALELCDGRCAQREGLLCSDVGGRVISCQGEGRELVQCSSGADGMSKVCRKEDVLWRFWQAGCDSSANVPLGAIGAALPCRISPRRFIKRTMARPAGKPAPPV
jgi:hypothetical protein